MTVPKEIKMAFALCAAQDGKCFYCAKDFTGPVHNGTHHRGSQWTRDHLISKQNGGGGRNNLVLACYRCNQLKSSDSATQEEIERAARIWAKAMSWGNSFYGRSVWWEND